MLPRGAGRPVEPSANFRSFEFADRLPDPPSLLEGVVVAHVGGPGDQPARAVEDVTRRARREEADAGAEADEVLAAAGAVEELEVPLGATPVDEGGDVGHAGRRDGAAVHLAISDPPGDGEEGKDEEGAEAFHGNANKYQTILLP